MLLKLMERFPIIITIGGGLLGYVAGDMAVNDPAIKSWVDANMPMLHEIAAVAGVAIVLIVGKLLAKKRLAAMAAEESTEAKPGA
jgi:predicted tellurium resistance membrane protein TerC